MQKKPFILFIFSRQRSMFWSVPSLSSLAPMGRSFDQLSLNKHKTREFSNQKIDAWHIKGRKSRPKTRVQLQPRVKFVVSPKWLKRPQLLAGKVQTPSSEGDISVIVPSSGQRNRNLRLAWPRRCSYRLTSSGWLVNGRALPSGGYTTRAWWLNGRPGLDLVEALSISEVPPAHLFEENYGKAL